MAKLTLTDLANLQNEQTTIAAINANNTATETAMEDTLSRSGTTPNMMNADLDMNSYRIYNLDSAVLDSEPITLGQFETGVGATGAAPATAQFVTMATSTGLSNERVLTAGTGITITDAGAGSTVTIASPSAEAFLSMKIATSTTYTVSIADKNKMLCSNSGTLAQTFNLPATSSAFDGCVIGIMKTGQGTVTINVNGAEPISVGGYITETGSSPENINTLIMKQIYSFVILLNRGGTGGPGWSVIGASKDLFSAINGFYNPVDGRVLLDATVDYSSGNAYKFDLQPHNGGGLMLKLSTGQWKMFSLAGGVQGNLTNCYIDGVSGQNAAFNTRYWLYIKAINDATPTFNLSTTNLYTGATGAPFSVMVGDETSRFVGHLYFRAQTFTGTTTNGSAVVTGISSTSTLHSGMVVRGTGIPAVAGSPTTIASVDSGTQVTLSANATASGSVSLGFGSIVYDPANLLNQGTQSLITGFFSLPKNLFGMRTTQPTVTTTSTTDVLLGTLTNIYLMTDGSQMFWVQANGYASNSIAGKSVKMLVRIKNSAGSVVASGSIAQGTSIAADAKVYLTSSYSQPLVDDFYTFEVWGSVPDGGTGTFVIENDIFCHL